MLMSQKNQQYNYTKTNDLLIKEWLLMMMANRELIWN